MAVLHIKISQKLSELCEKAQKSKNPKRPSILIFQAKIDLENRTTLPKDSMYTLLYYDEPCIYLYKNTSISTFFQSIACSTASSNPSMSRIKRFTVGLFREAKIDSTGKH